MADYINKIRTTEGDKPVNYEALANKPSSLPNPNKIKFTGSVVAEYDGSSEVTVNIPNGASEEQAAQIHTNTNDISELKNKTSELKGDTLALSDVVAETIEVIDFEPIQYVHQLNGYNFQLTADLSKIYKEQNASSARSTTKGIVQGGKTYKVTYTKASDIRYTPGYAFTDEYGNVLKINDASTSGAHKTTEEVVAPDDAVYLYETLLSSSVFPDAFLKTSTNEYRSKAYTKEETNTIIEGMSSIFGKLGLDKSINLVSYRPVGLLSKGYICLSCDDGNIALTNYTIPKLKEMKQTYGKNIPFTFALMTNSDVFSSEDTKSLVREMLSDYGCSVAIHGSASYTTYSDDGLISFLNEQAEQLEILCGVSPTSIIYPNHEYNVKTATIAGSFYGVCGTGGVNKPIMSDYCVIPRSNMYTLYRYSLLGSASSFQAKKDNIKAHIDYAYDNHYILLPFFHDVDFSRDGTYWTASQCMELLEYCIDYAMSKGISFCTLGDIPSLT